MELRIDVGGWEHDCCGDSYVRGDAVDWTCVDATAWGHAGVHGVETHHLPEPGSFAVRGRVTDIAARLGDGSLEPVERVPTGRALCGMDETDTGELISLRTRAAFERETPWFVVSIEPAD